MASEDKAQKALQDGIDADAQPAQLLEELLTRHAGGEDLEAASTAVLKSFPDAAAMLNSKQIYRGAAAAAAASSFSTPAPKAKTSAPERGGACDETIVEHQDNKEKTAGTMPSKPVYNASLVTPCRSDAEETVMFGAKLSAAKSAPSGPRTSSASTPSAKTSSAGTSTPSAATPNPAASLKSSSSASASQREETVTFGSKITTPGASARAAAAAAAAAGAEDRNEGKTALKKGAVRHVKR